MRTGEAAARVAQQRIQQPSDLQQQPTPTMALPSSESLTDQLEFEERLKALKAESDRKKAEVAAQGGAFNILDANRGALPDYDNPPPLGATLFGGTATDKNPANEKEYAGTSFGPSQVGLAVASVALVGVFLVANGGSDLGYASRRPTAATTATEQQQQVLGEEQRKDLQSQLEEQKKRLAANEGDVDALEAAAVINSKLGDYATAATQLEQLVKSKPDDVDVWRVLAETRGAQGERAKASAAYRRAWTASKQSSLEILAGLSSSLVDEGKASEAVDLIRGLLDGDSAPSAAAAAAADGSPSSVELGLLLAKTYAQWRGHVPDAISQYDALIDANPQDFRPPLGKALLLREQGREGDAQRFILQAKFLAPKSAKPLVDAVIGSGGGN